MGVRGTGVRVQEGLYNEERHGLWCSAYMIRASNRLVVYVASVQVMKQRHKTLPLKLKDMAFR